MRFPRASGSGVAFRCLPLIGKTHDKVIAAIEDGDIGEEQSDDDEGIEHGVAVHQIIEDVVWGAISAHQEHVVVGDGDVGDIGQHAYADHDGTGNGHVLPFHGRHAGDDDVKRSKARDGMSDRRRHIVEGHDGIGSEILPSEIIAHDRAQDAEAEDEIQASLFDPPLGKGRHGDGDELDGAKEKRKIHPPIPGIVLAEAKEDDAEELEGVDDDGGDEQGPILQFAFLLLAPKPDEDAC